MHHVRCPGLNKISFPSDVRLYACSYMCATERRFSHSLFVDYTLPTLTLFLFHTLHQPTHCNMEGTTTGCFDSLFAAFGKRNNSTAESSRIPPAYTPPTEEKLPAYEDCVSKVSLLLLLSLLFSILICYDRL